MEATIAPAFVGAVADDRLPSMRRQARMVSGDVSDALKVTMRIRIRGPPSGHGVRKMARAKTTTARHQAVFLLPPAGGTRNGCICIWT